MLLASATTGPAECQHKRFLPAVLKAGIATPVLKWSNGGCFTSWCQTGWYASPAVLDINADGYLEVIAGSYDLVALNGRTGALEWRAPNTTRVWPDIAVADLTGDGAMEIVAGRGGSKLTLYNTAGTALWSINPFSKGEIRSLALADLENDGIVETIVGLADGTATRQINVVEPDKSVRPGFPARRDGDPGYGWGMYNQNVAAADINGDGYKEIIGPTDTHYITALDRSGSQLPTNSMFNTFSPSGPKVWSQVGVHVDQAVDLRGYANCGTEHRPNFADSPPVLADVNGDGTREIIVVGNVHNCDTSPYTDLYQIPFLFNADRSRWKAGSFDWTSVPVPDGSAGPLSEDYNVIQSAEPNPVVADLDGDGYQEILYSSYDGRLHAYWLDKAEHGSWPYRVTRTGEGVIRFSSPPVVADLDNNGRAEVLFASWVPIGSGLTGKLTILDSLGNLVAEVTLPAGLGVSSWNGALASPTLADTDNDGELEIILQTVYSGVVAYDLPGTAGARVLWGTGRGNLQRSGAR